jgi:23S rRNA pseudoU1915 N3-methylase RlmH
MKLAILAVGHKPPAWVAQGCAEYLKRMPRELPLAIVEIKPEARGSKTREQLLAAEKTRLLARAERLSATDRPRRTRRRPEHRAACRTPAGLDA